VTSFSDPKVQALWQAGKIRAAYEASEFPAAATNDHPFRDPVERLAAAARAHEHGTLCWYAARLAECEEALVLAYEERSQLLGDDHPDTLDTAERLAALAHYQFDPEAPRWFGDVIARLERVHGAESVRVAIAERNRAACLRDHGVLDEARSLIERSLGVLRRALPGEHPEVVAAFKVSALLHLYAGVPAKAIEDARRAVELGTGVFGSEHPFVAHAELTIASAELRLDKLRAAGKRLPSVIARIERGLGVHPMLGLALGMYAEVELEAGRNFLRAEELARRAIAVYGETYPDATSPMTWILFRVLLESGQIVESGELIRMVGDTVPRELQLQMVAKLANRLTRLRDFRQAVPWLERARDLCDDPEVAAQWSEQAKRLRDT
jgi:tetratricopeptide (TPR) repeat protein